MSHVDLGFSENCEPWQVTSPYFPSKIGGKPAWLSYENLPKPEELQCEICSTPMIFLCQIYAPYEENPANFHRILYIFICKNTSCCTRNDNRNLRIFRNSLPRKNKFYSFESPGEDQIEFDGFKWVKLCNLCGCLGEKICSKCKMTYYCSKDHQVIDWKEKHKKNCTKEGISAYLFPESEIVIEPEELIENLIDENKELEEYNKLVSEGKAGTLNELDETELEQHAVVEKDKIFNKFKERIKENSEQILRYERGGKPLYIAAEPIPKDIPNCELCGGKRQFEFQVMPQLLSVIKENDLDFGVLLVYTCKKSCTLKDGYFKEFIFKQDVSEVDVIS